MCGIFSYFNPNGINKIELEQCISALRKLKHRGPDGEGISLFYIRTGKHAILSTLETPKGIRNTTTLDEIQNNTYHLFLGHRRLKIIDLSLTGHQPMYDIGGDLCVIFNGEIYNYLELSEELKKLKRKFKSQSDTEV